MERTPAQIKADIKTLQSEEIPLEDYMLYNFPADCDWAHKELDVIEAKIKELEAELWKMAVDTLCKAEGSDFEMENAYLELYTQIKALAKSPVETPDNNSRLWDWVFEGDWVGAGTAQEVADEYDND